MNILGISLRRPSYAEVTSATILAVGLWLAVLGALRASGHGLAAADAGAALLLFAWSCNAVPVGIRVGRSRLDLVLNLAIGAALLGLYQAALFLSGL